MRKNKGIKSFINIMMLSSICFFGCNNINDQNKHNELNHLESDFVSFVSDYSVSCIDEMELTRIETIHEYYKLDHNVKPRFAYGYTFSINDDSKKECLYLKSDVYERLEHSFIQMYGVYPNKGIYKYSHLVSKESFDSNPNKDLLSYPIDSSVKQVPFQIDDYILLDVIKTYYDSNYGFSFVDTIDFYTEDSVSYLKETSCYENKNYYYSLGPQIPENQHFLWCWQLTFFGFEIQIEEGLRLYNGTIDYRKYKIEKDSSYYDELDSCLIKKELIEEYDSYYTYSIKLNIISFAEVVGTTII